MKRFIYLSLCSLFLLTLMFTVMIPTDADATTKWSVSIDSVPLTMDTQPIERNNRVLVPMRAIFEALDNTIDMDWYNVNKSISAKGNRGEIYLTINSNKSTVIAYTEKGNAESGTIEKDYTMDVNPFVLNSRTYVPLRFIAESQNCKVDLKGNNINIITDRIIPRTKMVCYSGTSFPNFEHYLNMELTKTVNNTKYYKTTKDKDVDFKQIQSLLYDAGFYRGFSRNENDYKYVKFNPLNSLTNIQVCYITYNYPTITIDMRCTDSKGYGNDPVYNTDTTTPNNNNIDSNNNTTNSKPNTGNNTTTDTNKTDVLEIRDLVVDYCDYVIEGMEYEQKALEAEKNAPYKTTIKEKTMRVYYEDKGWVWETIKEEVPTYERDYSKAEKYWSSARSSFNKASKTAQKAAKACANDTAGIQLKPLLSQLEYYSDGMADGASDHNSYTSGKYSDAALKCIDEITAILKANA